MGLLLKAFFIFLVSVNYVSDKTEAGKVFYKKGIKISWNDFKGINVPRETSAITTTAISYDFINDNQVEVYCFLYKRESAVNKAKQTDYLLNHEQRHFDITYIFARKFEALLRANPNVSEENMKDMYNAIITEWNNEQNKYDEETDNSMNKEQQELWDRKIDNQLTNL